MSKATICDKCGKLIRGRCTCQVTTVSPISFYNGYDIHEDPDAFKYDLCDKCQKELMVWLKNDI